MAKGDKDLQLIGFDEFERIVNPQRFTRDLHKEVAKATKKNSLFAEARIKLAIDSGKFASNRPATVAIKGSSRPLVDSGQLKKSISHRLLAWHTSVIGVIRGRKTTRRGGSGNTLLVAKILHEGATIVVTPRMRKYFAVQSRTTPGWRPLAAGTVTLSIPPRPFLNASVTAKAILSYTRNWADAVQRAIEGKKRP